MKFKPNSEYSLMDQVREALRYYHYAYRTEKSYSYWILQYIKFYGNKIHPKDMGKNEVERFLSYLAEKKCCCRNPKTGVECLDIDLGEGIVSTRSKRRVNLPTVFTQKEVAGLLAKMGEGRR